MEAVSQRRAPRLHRQVGGLHVHKRGELERVKAFTGPLSVVPVRRGGIPAAALGPPSDLSETIPTNDPSRPESETSRVFPLSDPLRNDLPTRSAACLARPS